MTPLLSRLTTATNGLGAAATALSGPLGVAFAAITGLGAGVATLWATYEQGKSSVDDGSPKETPTLLNGAGGELTSGASPVFQTFRVCPQLDFGLLRLPNPFTIY